MPELPEVETTRRKIAPLVTGRTVLEIEHFSPDKYPDTELAHGRIISEVQRRGKYLILPLADQAGGPADYELIVHLGMTGGFRLEETQHTRLTLRLNDGALHFHDPRRFGKVRVVRVGDYAALPTLAAMGPEPLEDDFALEPFAEAAAKAGAVKPWLLSQKPVAGVGNIYADEALWRAQIHPAQTRLSAEQAAQLHTAIREVMEEAVNLGGSSLGGGTGNYRQHDGDWGGFQLQHAAYGRGGQPCPRCGTPIEKTVLGQRGTHHCPQCQPS
ncbi:DNA-formamidopyrimidine glycosylase [Deinococcus radiophilus]|uniref:Formamidopyrimidine-DNA glycosylase n=1 Tax=Deinococcus radiophilus TaxID=32062 RepID=A0A431VYN6_9DEIO|nr:DNA-formamidopyrimidine glycosylase [Deinococcus radiophilus]RTR28334.1 DNA-formamidopyrimidine glycosylase [Deinococcus radiophilus]UFA51201.1 DNA-formamidopyrimidine glycosylase [Deinococcus radiophilus]